jgi:hypothetical protein
MFFARGLDGANHVGFAGEFFSAVIPGHREAMSPESIQPQSMRLNGFRVRACARPGMTEGEKPRFVRDRSPRNSAIAVTDVTRIPETGQCCVTRTLEDALVALLSARSTDKRPLRSRPRLAEEEEAERILSPFASLSEPFATHLDIGADVATIAI